MTDTAGMKQQPVVSSGEPDPRGRLADLESQLYEHVRREFVL